MIDELEMRLLHEADHPACNRDIWPEDLLREAAADIVVKKAAIAESARMIHKLMTRALAAEARLAEAMRVIEPFALIAEHDIGSDETDLDTYQPMTYNTVPRISVGHLRAARSFLNSARAQQESSDADQ